MEGLMNDETRASQRQRNALECPMLPLAHYFDQAGLGYLVCNVLPVDVDFDARINNERVRAITCLHHRLLGLNWPGPGRPTAELTHHYFFFNTTREP
jgi:hypothetical protein